jgi:radical SAM superfamily enzyme YgiQ (UPF0313 family)
MLVYQISVVKEDVLSMRKGAEKKFLFVNLSIESGYYGVNHGIAYLVPVVRRNSFKVFVLNIVNDISGDEFRKQIESLNPSIVGYSCTSLQIKYLIKYSNAIKDLSDILQIAGGVGPTLDPEGILSKSSVDGVVIGEGETPLDNLLKTGNEGGNIYCTKGFYWRREGKIESNVIPQFISDLSQLEFPDYTVFDKDVVQLVSSLNLMLSRGCPYSCNYCCNKAIKAVYPSTTGYFRVPSVEHSIGLIEEVIGQYPETRYIDFEDDLLIAKKSWFLSFANEYQKRIALPYRANVRTECIDVDIVKALKESGCDLVFLGLESGNEELRKRVLNRHYSNSQIIEKSRMIKNAGIMLFTFNMVGLPFETKQHLQDTFELNKKIGTDCGECTFFYPFPGTELYEVCKREGLLKEGMETEEMPTNFSTRPVLRLTPEQEKESIRARKKLLNYFYWRDLIYEYRKFRSAHNGLLTVINLMRLLAVYLLKRFSSRVKKNSLYRMVMENKVRIWLWRKIFRPIFSSKIIYYLNLL